METKKVFQRKINQIGAIPDKLDRLTEHLRTLREQKFTGYIKVNYSQGSIARIEKFEEILKK
jgi:hypothetical protein